MDEDGNKQLSQDELSEGLKECGLELSSDEIVEMFTKLDLDGSGGINVEEFIVAVRVSRETTEKNPKINHPPAHQPTKIALFT